MPRSQLRLVVQALEGFVERIVRKIALDVTANLVRAPGEGGTPVDTGWARANWVPNIGSPAPAGNQPTTRAGRTSAIGSAQGAQAAGEGAVAGYRVQQGNVHITNNVPYIVRLNEGHSQQAPAGFVQAAIAKAVTVDLRGGLGV